MSNYPTWLRRQLAAAELLADCPEPDEQDGHDLRAIVSEAERRATAAGLPDAVSACQIRGGPISVTMFRRILSACLAASKPPQSSESMTVKQAAEFMGISPDLIYDLARDGKLAHKRIGRTIRFRPADLESYLRDSTHAAGPAQLRYL